MHFLHISWNLPVQYQWGPQHQCGACGSVKMVYICNWDCNGSSMLFTLFLPLYDYMHLTPLVLRVCQALRHNFVHMAKQSVKRLESRHELFIFESSGVCGVFSDKALPASRQQIQIPKRWMDQPRKESITFGTFRLPHLSHLSISKAFCLQTSIWSKSSTCCLSARIDSILKPWEDSQ